MKHASLFSGIGGFDLAAEWMDWQNVLQCEYDEFCQTILKYYWPYATQFKDIKTTDFSPWAGSIDILTGGFPCQPFSSAGKRQGTEDDRHLWPEMLRAIREIEPQWVVGENVGGIVNWNEGLVFEQVQADLEAKGYDVQPFILPAAGVNAPHRRDRTWFIAYSEINGRGGISELREKTGIKKRSVYEREGEGWREVWPKSKRYSQTKSTTDTQQQGLQGQNRQELDGTKESTERNREKWQNFPTQSPVCSGDDGLPTGLDGITFPKWRKESIKGYGNAIVPQVAFQIFKAIQETIYNESTRP